jgi:hypothetical protein
VKLAVLLALVAACAVSCGGAGTQLYTLVKTRSCLTAKHVRVGGTPGDIVALTATGGALRAHLRSNFATVVFGATLSDAGNIDEAYRRFAAKNVGVDDVLYQQGNAVMLWHDHPSNADAATVTGCLK